ncbi:hypothetical protein [Vagococcus salmoninarum]|uniref:hypothetical protein n=1 Tax=Vagococcus salmoninarum TaxID=2739 RepID=UPI003F959CEF
MRMYRLPDPNRFIEEFKAGQRNHQIAGHHLLISQLQFEILFNETGGSKLATTEKSEVIVKYEEAIQIVKDDYKEITGDGYEYD